MSRSKVFIFVLLALVSTQVARGFSLLGQYDEWQVERIGYRLEDDLGGPMNLGEEYRWNVPVVTYGFDESFINYFGSNGVAAIEQAFQILNDLPPASQITPEMVGSGSETFPSIVKSENPTASALGLLDLKSYALHVLIEEMGLADPERFVYTLRSRTTTSSPDTTNWVVIQRNFDPVTFEPTPYINDVLYIYNGILETQNPDVDFANTVQVTLEPNAGTVAGILVQRPGLYYPGTNASTALTRDDVGGLRYLLRPNNVNVERLLPGTLEIVTNKNNPILLTNYDLSLLIRESVGTTNDTSSRLSSLFPGVVITGTNTYFTNLITTNVTSYFTNFPYALGEDVAANQIFETNFVTNVVQVYDYTVGNVATNVAMEQRQVILRTIDVSPAEDYTPGGGTIRTNITEVLATTNVPGRFYVIPTNFLSYDIITNIETGTSETTNVLSSYVAGLVAVTNTNASVALTTYDLHDFLLNTRNTTNTLAQVLTNYPGAVVTTTNSRSGFIAITNVTSYFTNYPWSPTQIFVTNITYAVVTNSDFKVANVVSNPVSVYSERDTTFGTIISPDYLAYDETRPLLIQEFEVVPGNNYLLGLSNSFQTNFFYISNTFEFAGVTNWYGEEIRYPFGECFIVPTNQNTIGYSYLSTLFTNVTTKTNVDYLVFADMVVHTNTDLLDLTFTYDLTTFTEQARTNDPGGLLALYPDLLILNSNRYFTNIVSSNFVMIFTNSAWDPAGTLVLTQQWFYTTNVATNWNYTFGNVVTNFGSQDPIATNALLTIEEEIVATKPYDLVGTPATTNFIVTTVITNSPVGNIYIVPTNQFGWYIDSTQLVDVVAVTNFFVFTNISTTSAGTILQTNTTRLIRYETNYLLNVYPIEILSSNEVATNIFGQRREIITYSTNTTYEVYPILMLTTNELGTNIFGRRQEVITYFRDSVLMVNPVVAQAPTYEVGLRPGVDKINFVRVNYESLTGTNLLFTNTFTLGSTNVVITNTVVFTNAVVTSNSTIQQVLMRRIAEPDILIQAADLGISRNGFPFTAGRTFAWENNDAINGNAGLAGPGIIRPRVEITFSKLGQYDRNRHSGNQFVQGLQGFATWASFDSSTNIVVYPTGTTIQDIEQQILTP